MHREVKIYCPKCSWEPTPGSRWFCRCGCSWNTFTSFGQCPDCGYQWKDTQCLPCAAWSPHVDWYHELLSDETAVSEREPEKEPATAEGFQSRNSLLRALNRVLPLMVSACLLAANVSPARDFSEYEIYPDEDIVYRAFSGTIGGRTHIRVFLWRLDDSWSGSYFYASRRLPLALSEEALDDSSRNPEGKTVFSEQPLMGPETATGRWEGVFDEGARSYSGIWRSPDGKTALPITLRESYEGGALPAVAYRFSSSWTQARNNAEARRENSVVLVHFEGETQAVERINAAIRAAATRVFTDDSAGTTGGAATRPREGAGPLGENPFAALEAAIRVKPIAPDEIFFGALGHDTHELTVFPIHNEGGLLSVRLFLRDYAGGAHGNYTASHLTFETTSGRLLDLRRDMLRPGFDRPLAKVAEAQLRHKWGLKPGASLKENGGLLDVDEIELNDNWFVTVGGIGFSHDPYEIACFAAGFIEYVLPWDTIVPWLRKEAPRPGG